MLNQRVFQKLPPWHLSAVWSPRGSCISSQPLVPQATKVPEESGPKETRLFLKVFGELAIVHYLFVSHLFRPQFPGLASWFLPTPFKSDQEGTQLLLATTKMARLGSPAGSQMPFFETYFAVKGFDGLRKTWCGTWELESCVASGWILQSLKMFKAFPDQTSSRYESATWGALHLETEEINGQNPAFFQRSSSKSSLWSVFFLQKTWCQDTLATSEAPNVMVLFSSIFCSTHPKHGKKNNVRLCMRIPKGFQADDSQFKCVGLHLMLPLSPWLVGLDAYNKD